jgi:hypothetical protein
MRHPDLLVNTMDQTRRASEDGFRHDTADDERHTKDDTSGINLENAPESSPDSPGLLTNLARAETPSRKSDDALSLSSSIWDSISNEARPMIISSVPEKDNRSNAQEDDTRSASSGTADVSKKRKQGRRHKTNTEKEPAHGRNREANPHPNYEPRTSSKIEATDRSHEHQRSPNYNYHQDTTSHMQYRNYDAQTHGYPYPLRAATLPDYHRLDPDSYTSSYRDNSAAPPRISGQPGAVMRPPKVPFRRSEHLKRTPSYVTPQKITTSASRTTFDPSANQTALLGNNEFSTSHDLLSAHLAAEEKVRTPGFSAVNIHPDEIMFSVPVQCSHATLHSRFSTLLHQYWPERTAHNNLGAVWVKKARSSKRFKKRDGLHSIELTCHHGPMASDADDYQIQWL